MTPKGVLDFAKKNDVAIVDLKFIDLLGMWQHFSVPESELRGPLVFPQSYSLIGYTFLYYEIS